MQGQGRPLVLDHDRRVHRMDGPPRGLQHTAGVVESGDETPRGAVQSGRLRGV